MLGILSDIFERFDTLAEQNHVHKVKTIGDAYIVCAGALTRPKPDDAQRVVRMGLAMQDVVRDVASRRAIDIGVRIGVHTGRCTGGIIGTVRIHFDMWGSAVVGAVRASEPRLLLAHDARTPPCARGTHAHTPAGAAEDEFLRSRSS